MPNDTQKQTDPARSAAERIDSIAEDHHCHASIVEEAEAIIREEHVELHAIRDAAIKWNRAKDNELEHQYTKLFAFIELKKLLRELGTDQ